MRGLAALWSEGRRIVLWPARATHTLERAQNVPEPALTIHNTGIIVHVLYVA